jgi:hypothetical protein
MPLVNCTPIRTPSISIVVSMGALALLHYLKLKKEEVIYKGSVRTNTRVLPLHTAYASRASARDHVTWNATSKTVTQ